MRLEKYADSPEWQRAQMREIAGAPQSEAVKALAAKRAVLQRRMQRTGDNIRKLSAAIAAECTHPYEDRVFETVTFDDTLGNYRGYRKTLSCAACGSVLSRLEKER